ncbi:hypothetical protein D910_11419 [Dendroctonus ponderosae]|uniref:DNA2/NAM7 helicase helicase domain-containing protein n=1 Tax=Dendroctonus ponderosae TaxID=77166 RepID=U4ULY9_DENPD|nr:hypothetical protein D910_11419 [Dendroctonus ponderosae]
MRLLRSPQFDVFTTLCDKKRNTYFWNNPDDFWKHLICFAKIVQELIPTGHCGIIQGLLKQMTVFFPLIESTHSISITRKIKDQTENLLTVVEKTIEDMAAQKKIVPPEHLDQAMAEPPDDFRQIEIVPCAQEILSEVSPFLRPNIVDRPFSDINQYLDIQFRYIDFDSDYLLMESKIYFEPYNHVLRALKQMRVDTFPMEKYIIKLELDFHPPQYLRRAGPEFDPFEIPARPFHNFNESQLNAYKAALTNEFAIIQGPPGTGKTYLGKDVLK